MLIVNLQGVAVEVCVVFVERATRGGAFEGLAILCFVERPAGSAAQYGSVPVRVGFQTHIVVVGTGTLECYKIAEGGAADEDALVSTVDGHRAADVGEGIEIGLVDVDDCSVAEGRVANVFAGAGIESEARRGENEEQACVEDPRKPSLS